ncbi:MAG: hypothetical protein ACOCX7_00270 [Bacteroidota bacterium]
MMKKLIAAAIFALAGIITAANIYADEPAPKEKPAKAQTERGANFVDADNDGVCDHYVDGKPGKGQGRGHMKARGMGYKKHMGQRGANFVDADGDGVCDNYTEGKRGRGMGKANGHRMGKCDGTGPRGNTNGAGNGNAK